MDDLENDLVDNSPGDLSGSFETDPEDIQNLPSIGDLSSLSTGLLTPPQTMDDLDSLLGLGGSTDTSGLILPLDSSGNIDTTELPGLGGSASSNPLSGAGSLLGSILGTGLSALQGLVIAPATAAAALPGQTAAAQLQAEEQAAATASETSSITTILLWAAIAYGIVLLFEGFSKKV